MHFKGALKSWASKHAEILQSDFNLICECSVLERNSTLNDF